MPTLGAARYSRTVEKVTVGMSASNSQAEASCVRTHAHVLMRLRNRRLSCSP